MYFYWIYYENNFLKIDMKKNWRGNFWRFFEVILSLFYLVELIDLVLKYYNGKRWR